MNKTLLHTDIQEFINTNLNNNISKLLFKGSPFSGISIQELVEQIESKNKAEKKLPTWFNTQNIYYPNKRNIEQTSSEITARYKAALVSGNTLIDLTGGFGVDAYYFSRAFQEVIHCEKNEQLSEIVHYNLKLLNANNIITVASDGLSYLEKQQKHIDCIYIDPSRRDDIRGKVFLLKDSEPNVPKHLEMLFGYSDIVMIKASPLLDITNGINELQFVFEVHVVAVENEVKELLFILKKGFEGAIKIKTINVKKASSELFESYYLSGAKATYSEPEKYLYEPNAAILKAGLFNEVSNQLTISKLHINSHLYTSDKLIGFPGRRFEVLEIINYNSKEIKRAIPSLKANITTRNFPEPVSEIRKKTKLMDGGDSYLFFTTDLNDEHVVIICRKV